MIVFEFHSASCMGGIIVNDTVDTVFPLFLPDGKRTMGI